MNPKTVSETETLRSDIEMTRRRMDDTMDALGERLHGRHLVDEVIGFFRGSEKDSGTGARIREKVSQSAGTAANAVVDTIKKNPLPILLVTAGAAWLAYSATKGRSEDTEDMETDEDRYDPDTHYDRQLEYPSSASEEMDEASEEGGSKFQQMKGTVQEKASAAKEQIKDKVSDLSDRARDKFQSLKERASDVTDRVQDRTREMYSRTRDRVAQTADEHPIGLGLGCLAVGVLVGLAIPTPAPVNRLAGPTVERLRNRTKQAGRDMVQKSKRVVQAASDAAKHEAESQGLTLEQMRQSVTGSGGEDEAAHAPAGENTRAGAVPVDPSAAGPAM